MCSCSGGFSSIRKGLSFESQSSWKNLHTAFSSNVLLQALTTNLATKQQVLHQTWFYIFPSWASSGSQWMLSWASRMDQLATSVRRAEKRDRWRGIGQLSC